MLAKSAFAAQKKCYFFCFVYSRKCLIFSNLKKSFIFFEKKCVKNLHIKKSCRTFATAIGKEGATTLPIATLFDMLVTERVQPL